MKFASNTLIAQSLLVTLGLLSASCGSDSAKEKVEAAAQASNVENDEAKLAERLDTKQSNIPLVEAPGQETTNLALLDTFTALQVGELTAPTVGGLKVQANDVFVSGLATYVGYNYAGETYAGGIDVLDITNILSLKVVSSLSLVGTDINGIERNGSNLYAVGATAARGGGMLSRIALNGSLMTSTITEVALPSFAGTDIVTTASKIYTTSGDAGAMNTFDLATMTQSATTPITDARSVGVTTAGIPMVLTGQPAKVNVMSAAGAVTSTFNIGGAVTPQSKSTIVVGSKWSAVSLGEAGFKVICNADGSTIASVPQVIVSGLAAAKTVTNSVSVSNGLIYTANGEAGVYVYALRDSFSLASCGAGNVSLLGTLNFGATFSANGVYANGLNLYVVTGLGGLKILTTVFVAVTPVSTRLL